MSNQPRFLPPEGKKEFHLATTDGHSCVIHEVCPVDKKPGTVIPERFRKIAIGEGCGVVGMDFTQGKSQAASKTDLIIAAIAAVLDRQQARLGLATEILGGKLGLRHHRGKSESVIERRQG